MSLAKQIVDLPIVGGVDTGTEDHLQARLEVLENGVYRKRGGISKRFGTRKRGDADDIPVGDSVAMPDVATRMLGAYGDICALITDNKIYSFSDSVDEDDGGRRVYRDRAPETVATYDVIASQVRSFSFPDVAYGAPHLTVAPFGPRENGFFVYVYGTDEPSGSSGALMSSIRDDDGAVLSNSVQIGGEVDTFTPRVVFVENAEFSFFVCTYADFSTAQVYASFILASDLEAGEMTWSSPVDIGLALPGPSLPFHDLTSSGPAAFAAVTADPSVGGFTVTKIEYDEVNDDLDFTTVAASTTVSGITAIGVNTTTNGNVVVAESYAFGGTTYVEWDEFDPVTLTEPFAGPNIAWSMLGTADPIRVIAVGPTGADGAGESALVFTSQNLLTYGAIVAGDAIVAPVPVIGDQLRVVSKVWRDRERAYVALQRIGNRGGVFVCQVQANNLPRPVATILPRQSEYEAWPATGGQVSGVASRVAGEYVFGTHASVDGRGSIFAVVVEHNTPRMLAESNSVAVISGGVPSSFDGASLAEVGYLLVPDPPIVSTVVGGGALGGLSYQYALVREWVDTKANVHRSAPAFSAAITPGAGNRVLLEWKHLSLTTKDDVYSFGESPIANIIYRTETGGTTFRRITPTVPTTTFINVPGTTASEFYTDGVSDASIADNEILYTTGVGDAATALDNVNPPSAKIVHVHKNRFWLAGTDDDAIWYSKILVQFEGPAFSDALTVPRFDGGRVTALGSLDDLLCVFKRGSIFVLQGEGGDDNGANSTLTEPRRIASDTGCVEARSLVLTPDGLMFLSIRGLYLLDRALAVKFIGDPVSAYTQEADAVITSAVLVPEQNQVRFTVTRADPTLSVTLVWDYLAQAWSTARYHDAFENGIRGAASACLVAGAYRWITPRGQEYEEDESTFLDVGATWVPMTVETAWIKLAGSLQGYQRVWRVGFLAEWKTSHSASVGVRSDYVTTLFNVGFTNAVVDALSPYQLEIHPRKQRCSAIRVRFEDGPTADAFGTGEGATLTAVTLEYGILQGKNRGLAAVQKG